MGKRKKLTRRQKREASKMTNNTDKKKSNYDPSNFTVTKAKPKWNYTPKPPCHTGQPLVFTTDTGINVYAGGKNRSGGWHKMDFIPDLAMGPDETLVYSLKSNDRTVVPDGFTCGEHVGKPLTPPPIIALDFPDFGIPKVGPKFWYALAHDIVDLELKNISVQCAGGHGRTGIQLCILYYLLNDDDVKSSITDAAQLIELIRDMHCVKAVEGFNQQSYIARILDIPVGDNLFANEGKWNDYTWPTGGDTGKANGVPVSTTNDAPPVEKQVVKCPCCDLDEYYNEEDGCASCGYEKPQGSIPKEICYSCGEERKLHHFMNYTDEHCITCTAKEMGIKHTHHETQCGDCKKLKHNSMMLHDQDGIFTCMACGVKR